MKKIVFTILFLAIPNAWAVPKACSIPEAASKLKKAHPHICDVQPSPSPSAGAKK